MKQNNAFVRVRDEGNKVTMTYKQFDAASVDGAKEYEVTVGDFDETVKLLSASGLEPGSLQESRREVWLLDGVEIVLDEWPWLNPYIEIEGQSEKAVVAAAAKLGFSWDDAIFGDVMAAYRAQYPGTAEEDRIGDLPIVRFGDPRPKIFVD